jgi:5-methylcytosine-specific restriction endonuclease McrA
MAQTPISTKDKAEVLRRDRWLCRYCGAPVVFAPAMRMVDLWTAEHGAPGTPVVANYHPEWPRDRAPLLDWLGAVVNRRVAESRGGGSDPSNLVTACNQCVVLKKDAPEDEFLAAHPRPSSGTSEPTGWDGFSTMFVLLAPNYFRTLSGDEREWLAALRDGSR